MPRKRRLESGFIVLLRGGFVSRFSYAFLTFLIARPLRGTAMEMKKGSSSSKNDIVDLLIMPIEA